MNFVAQTEESRAFIREMEARAAKSAKKAAKITDEERRAAKAAAKDAKVLAEFRARKERWPVLKVGTKCSPEISGCHSIPMRIIKDDGPKGNGARQVVMRREDRPEETYTVRRDRVILR